MSFPEDCLVLAPDDIDLARSPLAGKIAHERYATYWKVSPEISTV